MKVIAWLFISVITLNSCKRKKTIYNLSSLPKSVGFTITKEIYDGKMRFYQINYELANNSNVKIENLKISAIMYLEGKSYHVFPGGSKKYEKHFSPGLKTEGRFSLYISPNKPDSVVIVVLK